MSVLSDVRKLMQNNEDEKAIKYLEKAHMISKRKAEILLEQFLTMNIDAKNEVPRKVSPSGLDILSDRDFEDFFSWFFTTFTFQIESHKFVDRNNLMIIASKDGKRIVVYANRNNPSNPVDSDLVKGLFYKLDMHNGGKGIIITSSYFTQNAIIEAKNLNIELWDYNTFQEKIDGLEKAIKKSSSSSHMPEFKADLPSALMELDNFQSLYMETKNKSKYYIRKRGIKSPLITFTLTNGVITRCAKCVDEKTFTVLREKEFMEIDIRDPERAYEEIRLFLSAFL